jgi:hypothetical protein
LWLYVHGLLALHIDRLLALHVHRLLLPVRAATATDGILRIRIVIASARNGVALPWIARSARLRDGSQHGGTDSGEHRAATDFTFDRDVIGSKGGRRNYFVWLLLRIFGHGGPSRGLTPL